MRGSGPRAPFSLSFSLTVPSRPSLRTIRPRTTRSAFFNDLEVESPLELHPGSAEDDADRAGGPSLFPDHLAEVFRRHLELEDGRLLSLELGHLHSVRLVH